MTQVNRPDGWMRSLDQVYPTRENRTAQDYTRLANRYLETLTARSASPVVIVWDPALGDLRWAYVARKISKLRREGGNTEARRLENETRVRRLENETRVRRLENKARSGHVALAWRAGGQVRYASFAGQQVRLQDGTHPGRWDNFLQDVRSYGLPSTIHLHLTKRNRMTFLGKPIEGWDIQRLENTFQARQRQIPRFHMRTRNRAHSCSTMVLDLLQASVRTGWLSTVHESWRSSKETVQSGGLWNMVKGSVSLPMKLYQSSLSALTQSVISPLQRLEVNLRQNGTINPNLINRVFWMQVGTEMPVVGMPSFDQWRCSRISGRERDVEAFG